MTGVGVHRDLEPTGRVLLAGGIIAADDGSPVAGLWLSLIHI